MAAHTAGAKRAKLPDEEINSLRLGKGLEDSKLNALANFARLMVQNRGWVDEKDIENFLSAGYTKANIFDVIIALAMKTLSNYTNHIVDTTLDDSISKFKWNKD
jgi:alkylhydroperoxidase family enzyme